MMPNAAASGQTSRSSYLPDRIAATTEAAAVERTVAAKTPALALSGRVDRIDDTGEELVIVDYKTGRAGVGQDDARGSRAGRLNATSRRSSVASRRY